MTARVTTETEWRAAGTVARVTVCNAAKLNILGSAMMDELAAAFRMLADDENLRVVVLAGEGRRAMIGGADINEMAKLTADAARIFITRLHGVCTAIRALPVPVIARLEGFTLGAGLEIAAACDLRIAAQGAKFAMPETRIGIPSVIEAALLPLLIGWGRTRRLLYTGETIDAMTGLAWGLVEDVVLPELLDAAIDRIIADLLLCGPRAIRLQKQLMREWEDVSPAAGIALGIDCFAKAWTTDEPIQMMKAFLATKKQRDAI